MAGLAVRGVLAKSVSERVLGFVIGAAVIISFLWMGMVVYQDIDLSLYTGMPEAFRELVGITDVGDASGLAYQAIYSSYGALTMFSLAIAMGSATIAGEERKGSIGMLLGNPVSRSRVLAEKSGALVLLVLLGVGLLWLGAVLVPVLVGADVSGRDIPAMMIHMFVASLFFGFLAMAVGAWTGSNAAANAVAAGVLVVSFFATGLLPLFEGWADLSRAFPWHYYDGAEPLLNGVDVGHLAVLGTGTVLFAGIAWWGLNRRDLRSRNVGVSLLDRLREVPQTKQIADRLAGGARVSGIVAKTASEYQTLALITTVVMFSTMGVMIGAIYGALDDSMKSLGDTFPESMLALFGGGDLSTVEGFYQIETFGMMGPIGVMLLTIMVGSKALAGEEENDTMGMLLANPVSRRRVLLDKAVVMVGLGALVALATFAGVALSSVLFGLGMSLTAIAATCLLMLLLGLFFGAVALLLSGATGRVRIAVWGAVGLALASHVLNAYLPFSEQLAGLARLTPNYYYLTSDPLITGMDWGHGLVLAAGTSVLIAAALLAFDRRDLRQG